MFGVDPSLRFAHFFALLLPKLSCNQDKTLRMHAIFLLEGYKLSVNSTNHIQLMYLGREKYSSYYFQNESTYNQSRDWPPLLDPDPGFLLFFVLQLLCVNSP
jgi:hypothetical protein